MKERLRKSLSLALGGALMWLSAGVEPYAALAQVRTGMGEPVGPELPGEPLSSSAESLSAPAPVDAPSLGAASRLSNERLEAPQARLSEAAPKASAPRSIPAGLARSAAARVGESIAEPSRGPDGAPLTRLFDSVAPSVSPSIDVPESAGLGSAAESLPPAAEARLGKISVSYALEAVLEDLPDGRTKVVHALADESFTDAQREAYFAEFVSRIREASGREGVPADVFPIAKQFLSEVAESKAPANVRQGADDLKGSLDVPSPLQKAALAEARSKGLSEGDAVLASQVAQRQPGLSARPGFYQDVKAAAQGLREASIVPTGSLVREAVRSASTSAWLDALTAGRLRSYRLSKAVERLSGLKAALEKREPNLFSDREVDVYYSVLSKRVDIGNSGYYGFRKRVDAARAFVREAGIRPSDAPKLPGFSLFNSFQPFDVSGVDRSVIVKHRARISGAFDKVSSLAALADPRLAGIKDELIGRTWAYVKLWPELENEPRSKDDKGRAVPIGSKQVRGYYSRAAATTSIQQMEEDLRGAGRYLFVGLHVTISQVLASAKPVRGQKALYDLKPEQVQALHELMVENMLAYQWTDDVARAELNIGDDPAQWSAVEIKLALERLGYIYFDKSQEFQAFKTGVVAPSEVKEELSAGRHEAKDQLASIIVNKGTRQDETVEFVPAMGVSSLFRGFCGRDCSKSLAPERGKLVLRSFQPHSAAYLGLVDGVAVGYLQLFEAMKGGEKVLLAEVVQFPERESMTPRLLEKLDELARAEGYAGLAVPASLHPFDPVAKETMSNFTNFQQTVKSVKNMKAWQDGESFKPEFPWAGQWARVDDILGKSPYYSWAIGEGLYKLLKFDPVRAELVEAPIGPSTGSGRAEDAAAMAKGREILEHYFKGQRWLIASFAMQYSLFSPAANAMGGEAAVGSGRSGYAGALAALAPFAGVLVERLPIRTILRACTATRAAIWAGGVPLAYYAFGPSALFVTAFAALMAADGAVVTVNTLVDIDENGIDFLAQQHGFPVDSALRNEYNAKLEKTYSMSRIVLPPIFAALGVVAASLLDSAAWALIGVMAASFAIPAVLSFRHYSFIPTDAKLPPRPKGASVRSELAGIAASLWDGAKVAVKNSRIRWRFVQYALERAREDAMLLVVLAEYGIRALAHGDKAWGALYTAGLISLGKIGAWIASWVMEHHWKAPTTKEGSWAAYKIFFPLAFAGSLATLFIPGAAALTSSPWVGAAIVAGASFVFNLFCTASAQGFRNLMQGIVNEEGAAGRIFGIQNTVLMGTNALAIGGLSAVFASVPLTTALWIACGLFAAVGAFEFFVAPRLLSTKAEREAGKK